MDIWFFFSLVSLAIASIAIFIGGFMAFFMDDTATERRKSWKKFKPVIISLFATFFIFLSLGYVFMDISSRKETPANTECGCHDCMRGGLANVILIAEINGWGYKDESKGREN
jgi:hypothetical protein